jgi:hypothetical protein
MATRFVMKQSRARDFFVQSPSFADQSLGRPQKEALEVQHVPE